MSLNLSNWNMVWAICKEYSGMGEKTVEGHQKAGEGWELVFGHILLSCFPIAWHYAQQLIFVTMFTSWTLYSKFYDYSQHIYFHTDGNTDSANNAAFVNQLRNRGAMINIVHSHDNFNKLLWICVCVNLHRQAPSRFYLKDRLELLSFCVIASNKQRKPKAHQLE